MPPTSTPVMRDGNRTRRTNRQERSQLITDWGRSRAGWTTRIHAAREQGQTLMGMVITAGRRSDSQQFGPVLDHVRVKRPGGSGRPRTTPDRVRGDKAFASAANRAVLRRRGNRATIPDKKDHAAHHQAKGSAGGRPPKVDYEDYQKRHAVECRREGGGQGPP